MHSVEEPHQNPENKEIQEEKPDNKKRTVKKNVKGRRKKQILAKEKREIIKLLSGSTAEKAEKKPVKKTPKKPVKSQIGSREKKEIILLITGRYSAKPTQPESKPAKKPKNVSTKKRKQINAAERKVIVSLLHDRFGGNGDITADGAAPVAEEIQYDKLNKQELVELFEETVEEKDIPKIKNQIGNISAAFHHLNKEEIENKRQEFISAGGEEKDFKHAEDPLEQRFKSALNIYKRNKAKYAEELEKEKHKNLELKHNILEELKELINSEETLKKTYDDFRKLQDRWREIGMVPSSELNNLWQSYHFFVEQFFDKIRINKELRDLDMKKNMEQKIQLCEKAEELLVESSILRSFKLLQKYHDEWREIGPVPSEYKEELWERFKAATDKINQRRKEHYAQLQDEQQKNYEAKLALCEKVEELVELPNNSLKEWQNRTNEINETFKVWKTIGRAPKAQNDEIWARFKKSLDNFFNNKRDFLAKVKERQMNNLNLKIDLCTRAEAIKDSDDWRRTTKDLINLQKEWKKIGPVPRRQSEKIWKRFRSACDEFFNRKADHFKNIHEVEANNLEKKNKLIEEIENFKISEDKKSNLQALKEFQRLWMEIGYVPFKEKDRLQKKYRAVVDALIDKMDINRSELSISGYKNKIEMIKHDPDASWRLSKERNNLTAKIKKLKEDLAVWENNIGFFAASKQSEKLRSEFEKKIELAKQEIRSYEDKVKILDKE